VKYYKNMTCSLFRSIKLFSPIFKVNYQQVQYRIPVPTYILEENLTLWGILGVLDYFAEIGSFKSFILKFEHLRQCFGSGSAWIRIQLVARIRIQEG
jgi:hypothetical protein